MAGNPYETSTLLNQYLLFHYATPEEILPFEHGPVGALNFAERCVSELVDRDASPQ